MRRENVFECYIELQSISTDLDNCNQLQFYVIDYNYENFNPRSSRKVRNLFQAIVIDYVIYYNYENFRQNIHKG